MRGIKSSNCNDSIMQKNTVHSFWNENNNIRITVWPGVKITASVKIF